MRLAVATQRSGPSCGAATTPKRNGRMPSLHSLDINPFDI